jgi:hypothetical protein
MKASTLAPMEALRFELGRLARGEAHARAGGRAARVHLLLLVGAVLLAFVHRAVLPLPALRFLDGSWLRVAVAAAVLYLLGPLLARGLARALRPSLRETARRVDDAQHWRDETTTALDVEAASGDGAVAALLVAQSTGRVRDLASPEPAAAKPGRRWPRLLLAALFAFLLLAPGVDGLFGDRGAGRGGGAGLGQRDALEPVGPPAPMSAQLWLRDFLEYPPRVEPLPEAAAAPGGKAPR